MENRQVTLFNPDEAEVASNYNSSTGKNRLSEPFFKYDAFKPSNNYQSNLSNTMTPHRNKSRQNSIYSAYDGKSVSSMKKFKMKDQVPTFKQLGKDTK